MHKVINTIRAIIMVALIAILLIFCFLNLQHVAVNFIFVKAMEIPLFIVIFATLVIGVFIGFLAGMLKSSKKKQKQNEVKKIVPPASKIDASENDLIA